MFRSRNQVVLPLEIEKIIPKDDYAFKLAEICDKLDYSRLEKAEHFLMIPEYISFKLTGIIKKEYTNATTTGLVNAKTKTWDEEHMDSGRVQRHSGRQAFAEGKI